MASQFVSVLYPAAPIGTAPRVIGLRVLQETFKHDVAIVKYYLERHNNNRYRNGSPVEIEWGFFPAGLELFVGTVHHTVTKSENNQHYLYVVCIGASYPMDEVVGVESVRPKSIPTSGDATTAVLPPGIVSPMCGEITDSFAATLASHTPARVALAVAADQDMNILLDTPDDAQEASKSWASPGETKWKFLVRLAMQNGFVFYVNKTTMYFYDPVKFLDQNKQSFPVLQLNLLRVAEQAPVESFTLVHSDDGNTHTTHGVHNQDNRTHIIRGVNPRTGQIISKTGRPPQNSVAGAFTQLRFSRTHHDTPTHTAGEAQQRANALARRHRWRTFAKVRAQGNARVHQGSGVILQGITRQDDGVWFVQSVEHELHLKGTNNTFLYMMNLVLARDSTSRHLPLPIPNSRPRRPLFTPAQRRNRRQARPVFRSGKWRTPFRQVGEL